jgi:hypothetical protein
MTADAGMVPAVISSAAENCALVPGDYPHSTRIRAMPTRRACAREPRTTFATGPSCRPHTARPALLGQPWGEACTCAAEGIGRGSTRAGARVRLGKRAPS